MSNLVRPFLLLAALGGCGLAWPEPPATLSAAATPPPPGTRALRISLGNGPPAYAVLLQEQGERRLWRSESDLALETDGPRVVATSGPPQVIIGSRIDGPDPLRDPEALLRREASARRLVDLATAARDPAGMRFGVEITCRLRATLLEDAPELLAVEEACRGADPAGAFTSRFTLRRADGAALHSEQWIGPGLPLLALEPAP